MRPTRPLFALAAIHLVGLAVLLWLAYYWLGVGETKASTLVWSIAIAVIILVAGCGLLGMDFLYFRDSEQPQILRSFQTSLRHILPLAIAAIVIGILYGLLEEWSSYSTKPALTIASWLTLKLRTPVRPSSIGQVFSVILWLIRWMLVPALLSPIFSEIAARGWRGFRPASFRKWTYWILIAAVLFCAIRVPLFLLNWKPVAGGFVLEASSFTARAVAAYLLFVCGCLALAFVTSRGTPRFTQPNTTEAP